MRILFHYDAGPPLAARFAAEADNGLVISACPERDDAGFDRLIGETEVLWHVLKPVTAEVVAKAPRLRLIQKIGVGVNTIDLDAAKARGIAVCNMPGTNSRAVAEMTLALMLAALRRLAWLDRRTRAGAGWSLPGDFVDSVGELGGRRVGLVGYGAVPRILAPILEALGAEVLYHTRAPKPDARGHWLPLEELLARSDVLSLHLPLTPETERMLDDRAFARMKPGAVLVNTARGGLVDEGALSRALDDGRIAAAGLDVFGEEPIAADHPFLVRDDIVLAPHVAWLTPETLARSLDVALENCRRLAGREDLLNRVI